MPSQAVPLFFVKFSKLIRFLRRFIEASAHLSVVNKYILVGDTTFFVVDFFTRDRASDLGRLLANQVFRLEDRKGFLLKFTLTKTFRGDTSLRTMESVLFPGLNIICLFVNFFPSN